MSSVGNTPRPRGVEMRGRRTLAQGTMIGSYNVFGETVSATIIGKMEEKMDNAQKSVTLVETIALHFALFKRNFWKSYIGQFYRYVIFVASIMSCLSYIAQTYVQNKIYLSQNYVFNVIERTLALIFTIDWIFNLIFADYRFAYATSYISVIDFCIIISSWTTYNRITFDFTDINSQTETGIYILFLLNTTRILRILKIRESLFLIRDDIHRCLAKITLVIGTMILFWSGVMKFLEKHQGYDFHTWTYFAVVTISTVGYGDISPDTLLGRIAGQMMIMSAIITVPQLTQELIEKLSRMTKYARAEYQPKFKTSQHILICGDVTSSTLEDIFHELYHEDHDVFDNVDIDTVVLQPRPPDDLILELLRKKSGRYNITYLQGSALVDSDLKRAQAETAHAVFIMTNKFSKDYDEEDAEIIMQQFNIKRYIGTHNPLLFLSNPKLVFCTQLIRPENRKHLLGDLEDYESITQSYHDVSICLNEIKMKILAKSTLYPGVCTFLLNLLSTIDLSSRSNSEKEQLNQSINCEINPDDCEETEADLLRDGWISEYEEGCDYEVYTTELADIFYGTKFIELSYTLYDKLGVVLFGLRVEDIKTKQVAVLLNPKDYFIPSKEDYSVLAFVLAKNKQSANLSFASLANRKNVVFSLAMSLQGSGSNSSHVSGANNYNRRNSVVRRNSQTIDRNYSPSSSSQASSQANNLLQSRSQLTEASFRAGFKSHHSRKENETEQEHIQRLEEEHFQRYYYLRSSPVDLHDIYIRTSVTREMSQIQNHIIIMGKGIGNIYELIRPLRARHLGKMRYIVILYPNDIPHNIWNKISIFDGIVFVRGSHLDENDICRAGIFRAQQVVVLADVHHERAVRGDVHADIESLLDSDAIFSYQCVKRLNPDCHIVVEMLKQSNIGFLDIHNSIAKNEQRDDFRFSPRFASGTVFTTSLLDTLVCQAYHNPYILDIIHKLIGGIEDIDRKEILTKISTILYDDQKSDLDDLDTNRSQHEPNHKSKIPPESKPNIDLMKIKSSSLYQIPIPEHIKKYESLYKYLASKDMIPLGILRGINPITKMGPRYNKSPYVVTNPSKATELFAFDRVFVLSPVPRHTARTSQYLEKQSSMPKLSTLASFSYSEEGQSLSVRHFKELESKVEMLSSNLQLMYQQLMKGIGKSDEDILPLIKSSSSGELKHVLNLTNELGIRSPSPLGLGLPILEGSKIKLPNKRTSKILEEDDDVDVEDNDDDDDDDDDSEESDQDKEESDEDTKIDKDVKESNQNRESDAGLSRKRSSTKDNAKNIDSNHDHTLFTPSATGENRSAITSPSGINILPDITRKGRSLSVGGNSLSNSPRIDGVGLSPRLLQPSPQQSSNRIEEEDQRINDQKKLKPMTLHINANNSINASANSSPLTTSPLSNFMPRRRSSSRVMSEINEADSANAISAHTSPLFSQTSQRKRFHSFGGVERGSDSYYSLSNDNRNAYQALDQWSLEAGYTIDNASNFSNVIMQDQLPGQNQLTRNSLSSNKKQLSPLITRQSIANDLMNEVVENPKDEPNPVSRKRPSRKDGVRESVKFGPTDIIDEDRRYIDYDEKRENDIQEDNLFHQDISLVNLSRATSNGTINSSAGSSHMSRYSNYSVDTTSRDIHDDDNGGMYALSEDMSSIDRASPDVLSFATNQANLPHRESRRRMLAAVIQANKGKDKNISTDEDESNALKNVNGSDDTRQQRAKSEKIMRPIDPTLHTESNEEKRSQRNSDRVIRRDRDVKLAYDSASTTNSGITSTTTASNGIVSTNKQSRDPMQ